MTTIVTRAGKGSPLTNNEIDANFNNLNTDKYEASNILGTVSESAGVPTGAVIERGSNANGQYVKFADGTMICTGTITVDTSITTALVGGYRSTSGAVWTFPAAFATNPDSVTSLPFRSGAISSPWGALSTTSVEIFFTAVTSQASSSRTALVSAIGRWFV